MAKAIELPFIDVNYIVTKYGQVQWREDPNSQTWIMLASEKVRDLCNNPENKFNDDTTFTNEQKEMLKEATATYAFWIENNGNDRDVTSMSLNIGTGSMSESRNTNEKEFLKTSILPKLERVGLVINQSTDFIETFYDTQLKNNLGSAYNFTPANSSYVLKDTYEAGQKIQDTKIVENKNKLETFKQTQEQENNKFLKYKDGARGIEWKNTDDSIEFQTKWDGDKVLIRGGDIVMNTKNEKNQVVDANKIKKWDNYENFINNLNNKTNIIKSKSEIQLEDNEGKFHLWGNGFGYKNNNDILYAFQCESFKKLKDILDNYENLKQRVYELEQKPIGKAKDDEQDERLSELEIETNHITHRINLNAPIKTYHSNKMDYGVEHEFYFNNYRNAIKIKTTVIYKDIYNTNFNLIKQGETNVFIQPLIYEDTGSREALATWKATFNGNTLKIKLIHVGKIHNNETPDGLDGYELRFYD